MPAMDGGFYSDLIFGTSAAELVHGNEGDDTIQGDFGDDTLFGDDGDDQLTGEGDSDVLYGGDGNDELGDTDGLSAALYGGAGDDQIGVERQIGSTVGVSRVVIDGGAGNDGVGLISGRSDRPISAAVTGGVGNDTVTAIGYVDASIDVGAGDDLISVMWWKSPLSLTLGAGSDVLQFAPPEATHGVITILDFQPGTGGDKLTVLDGSVLSNWLTNWDASNPFGTGHFRLIQQGQTTVLQIDANGGGDQWSNLVRFEGTTVAQFTAANLFGYAPDGSAPAGQIITGNGSSEALNGTFAGDTILGLGGDDTINGGGGADRLDGGDGNDLVFGVGGGDTAFGGAGNDTLDGQNGDQLHGQDGADYLQGNLFASGETMSLIGGPGDDHLRFSAVLGSTLQADGGDDQDRFEVFGAGVFHVDGGAGADSFVLTDVGAGARLTLGAGADLVSLRASQPDQAVVTITDFQSDAGGDRLDIAEYLDAVLPAWDPATNPIGAGLMRVSTAGSSAIIEVKDGAAWRPLIVLENVSVAALTAENLGGYPLNGAAPSGFRLVGTSANEIGIGSGGADTMEGGGGDDSIDGAAGDDVIDGGLGDDLLLGNLGNDILQGGLGFDVLDGDAGSDLLHGGADGDLLDDRFGRQDQYFGEDGDDVIFAVRSAPADRGADLLLDGGAGDDDLFFASTVAATGRLDGGSGYDTAHFLGLRSDFTVFSAPGAGGIQTRVIAHFPDADSSVVKNVERLSFNDLDTELLGIQQNHLSSIDGSRFDDVLFRSPTTGQVIYADMDGTLVSGGFKAVLGWLPAGWKAVGSGDFSNDGRAETVVQNVADGSIYLYGAEGRTTVTSSLNADWQYKGVGDFTKDGSLDVLVRSQSTGVIAFAEMNGTSFSGWGGVGNLGTGWATIGAGDFDRDGYSDVLVQNLTSGETVYASLHGAAVPTWGYVAGGLGTAWVAKEAVDLTGDGYFDVVFQSTTGQIAYVNMAGGSHTGWGAVAHVPGWDVVGSGDYDNDGYGDVLIRNAADGTVCYVNMDQGAFQGWGFVSGVMGSDWVAV